MRRKTAIRVATVLVAALFLTGLVLTACGTQGEHQKSQSKGASKIKLLFLGDSITHYWLTDGKKVWIEQFARWLPGNLGVPGDTTGNVLTRIELGVLDGLDPKTTVVLIGTNDLSCDMDDPQRVIDGVSQVIGQTRKKLPRTQILLLGIFPRGEKPDDPVRTAVKAVNEGIARLDNGSDIHYLDVGNCFLSADGTISEEVMPDFLHLTPLGYKLWAEAMKPELEKLMNRP